MMETDETWRQHLYLQTRLKEKNGRIRLLTIQSRQYTASRTEASPETIHCFLRLATLKERPQFTVVSHRWQATDATDETKPVLVNGAAVPVSAALFDVLGRLQRETEPAVVWIAALCVNHADDGERSVQVAQLPQIFAAAEKTFVWLGATEDRSDEAMRVLRRLADEQLTLSAYVASWTPQLGQQLVQKIWPARLVHHVGSNTTATAGPATGSGSGSGSSTGSKEPLELQNELEALRAPLKALMEREYWSHLWSLVELCLSSRGLVVCGTHGLALDHFCSAARALDHIINHLTYSKWLASASASATTNPHSHSNSQPHAGETVLRSEQVSNLSQSPALRVLARREHHRRDADSWLKSPSVPLFSLLSSNNAHDSNNNLFYPISSSPSLSDTETQLLLSSLPPSSPLRIQDPRDRIYALACLATDTAELGLVVDYALSVAEVFAGVSAAFLRKEPRVLQLARGTAGGVDNGKDEGNEEEEEEEKEYEEKEGGEGGGGNGSAPSWVVDWENVRSPPSYFLSGTALEHRRPFNACGPADVRFYRADTGVAPGQQVLLKAGVVDRVDEVGTVYELDCDDGGGGGDDDGGGPGPGRFDKQRAYLAEIARFWEESTASLSSPYFAEQAAVALAKIPVGDIEASDGPQGGFTRASSATVEGYKRTIAALSLSSSSASSSSSSSSSTEIAAADMEAPKEQEQSENEGEKEKKENEQKQEQEKGKGGEGEEAANNSTETTDTNKSNPGPSLPYLAAMARMAGRKPFRSHAGYVGLGPADLAVDDVVAIPYGSPVPFAFRRRRRRGGEGDGEGEDGGEGEGEDDSSAVCYRLVGEVYVFGIMDGEFMKVHRQETVLRVV